MDSDIHAEEPSVSPKENTKKPKKEEEQPKKKTPTPAKVRHIVLVAYRIVNHFVSPSLADCRQSSSGGSEVRNKTRELLEQALSPAKEQGDHFHCFRVTVARLRFTTVILELSYSARSLGHWVAS